MGYQSEICYGANKLETRPGMFIAGTVRPGGKDNANPFYQSEYLNKASESQLDNKHEKMEVAPLRFNLGTGVQDDEEIRQKKVVTATTALKRPLAAGESTIDLPMEA